MASSVPSVQKRSRTTAEQLSRMVLCTLRFYATGCYQRPVGEQWGISMSQSSISRCIHRVTDAINSGLFFEEVKFPMTQVDRQAAKEVFASAPAPFVGGTIGAVDCSHVSILGPKTHEEAYVNHHGYHSINVQMKIVRKDSNHGPRKVLYCNNTKSI
ncbi:putative nuclease HARBI1 isoform X1 [Rhagoletis pomonella]|uniref:putative nuclease HARBI1 isoform X1 n=1 Tax=Rhagoletis pomonella TaxID=28610 RepID=UPI00178152FB|nr:putative nuclease HARBI1 isoform X1 [Rhagoletis pomonella]